MNYSYGNSDWKDLLTGYNGIAISYDLSGNPLNWRNASSLSWDGRRLAGMTLTDGTELAFEYNADGLRTSKTVGNSIVQYVWNDGNLVAEIRDGYTMKFLYNNGEAAGFSYNGADYYYGKDSFGVIRYLYNTSGEIVTTYTYDAWGNVLSVDGTLAETVGTVNPMRYKSYYLDPETGWYYLQSRYYDPAVGRFLNADDVSNAGITHTLLSQNLFAYGENNPIVNDDYSGQFVIRRWMVAMAVDTLLTIFFPALETFFAPIKSVAKTYAKAALKLKIAGPLGTFLKFIAKNATKLLSGLQKGLGNLWGIGRWLANKIPVQKLVVKMTGAISSFAINKIINILVPNIDIILSLGGLVSGILDFLLDKKMDNCIWRI